MIRRCIVAVVAWALRRGVTPGDMMTYISRAFPHRDASWRLDLLGDAIDRNHVTVDARLWPPLRNAPKHGRGCTPWNTTTVSSVSVKPIWSTRI